MDNNLHFPEELRPRPVQLSDLGTDNRSIQMIYELKKSIADEQIKKDLDNVLRLACDALCEASTNLGIDPGILDYWDGESNFIITLFDPTD